MVNFVIVEQFAKSQASVTKVITWDHSISQSDHKHGIQRTRPCSSDLYVRNLLTRRAAECNVQRRSNIRHSRYRIFIMTEQSCLFVSSIYHYPSSVLRLARERMPRLSRTADSNHHNLELSRHAHGRHKLCGVDPFISRNRHGPQNLVGCLQEPRKDIGFIYDAFQTHARREEKL